ncbi:GAL4 [Penicillium atrosanguineum]|nr:GAL4 [Penicillium atrosanguineum]KAJ5141950.1 GAL4 [Penicillium atrosanguineum]
MMTNEEIWQDTVDAKEKMLSEGKSAQNDLKFLHSLVPIDLAKRLIKIYTQFVHPRLPILSREDLESMKETSLMSTRTGLISAIYAMATPFMFLDDELSLTKGYSDISVNTLWDIAYRSFHRNYSLAHISQLQLGLLLLQKPPDNFAVADSPESWALSCSCLAIAESLGINLDPGGWRLPRSEITLRRRLWWLMYTQHTWHALCFGRSVHLNEDNWDVKELTLDDLEIDFQDPAIEAGVTCYIPLFLAECQLSVIGADVLKEF